MATVGELKKALIEVLHERGVLDKLRAQVRSEIFHTLDDTEAKKIELSNENLIINELIREYLEHNNYKHSLSVFLTESGQPKEKLGRSYLTSHVNVQEDHTTRNKPLLNTIVRKQTSQKNLTATLPKANVTLTAPSLNKHHSLSNTVSHPKEAFTTTTNQNAALYSDDTNPYEDHPYGSYIQITNLK